MLFIEDGIHFIHTKHHPTSSLTSTTWHMCTAILGCVHTWVPEHGARVRFLLGTNVNTPFLQVPTPEFWHGARARVQGLDLVLGHCSGH